MEEGLENYTHFTNWVLPEVNMLMISSEVFPRLYQGGKPVSISITTQPTLQMSAGFPWDFLETTYGFNYKLYYSTSGASQ